MTPEERSQIEKNRLELNTMIAALDAKLDAMPPAERTAYEKRVDNRLRENGWQIGTVAEFLQMTPAESQFMETNLALTKALRRFRTDAGLSQSELAERIGSQQARIARAEAGNRGISLDFLFRALFAAGATQNDIADLLRQSPAHR